MKIWPENPLAGYFSCLVKSPEPPEPRKYEKITNKNTKSPTQARARKIRKNTEKIRKWPENVFFSYFFRIFFVFFSYFWGPTLGGGSCIFSEFFRVFGVQGVLGSLPGNRDHKFGPCFSYLRGEAKSISQPFFPYFRPEARN